jgi:hypothetical protein
MGFNLFVEGNPAPVVITVALPRNVTRFADVQQVASALAMLDREISGLWAKHWPSMKSRSRRETRLLSFHVSSPPVFKILADPAWLALFLAVLTFYKPAKESAMEIRGDLGVAAKAVPELIHRVSGLTERQKQLLEIAVYLTADKILEQGEDASLRVAEKFARARKQLIGDTYDDLDIYFDDIDGRRFPW